MNSSLSLLKEHADMDASFCWRMVHRCSNAFIYSPSGSPEEAKWEDDMDRWIRWALMAEDTEEEGDV